MIADPRSPQGHRGPGDRQFGDGVLFRFTNQVYWLITTELLFVLACLPLVLALLFLDRDSSNAILYALGGIFLGPALAATLHCVRKVRREQDLDPARDFLRGYRINVAGTLKFWVPAVAAATIVLLDSGFLQTQGAASAAVLREALLVVALLGTLWVMNMMVISTSFTFRMRDMARLSMFYLGRSLRSTVGNVAILFLATALLLFTSEWVLLACGSLFVHLFALNTADLVVKVEARFTGPSGGEPPTQNPTS
jgi:uncharacterized membrane protein YesL